MNRPRSGEPGADGTRGRGTWLTAALREQADQHEPDLGRIEAGVERLIAEPARPSRRPARLRHIGVPLGIATAAASVALAVTFVIGTGHNGHLSGQTVAPSSSRPAVPQPHRPTAPSTWTSPRPAHPPATASPSVQHSATPAAGPLTASGTVDPHSTQFWAQENLSIVTTRPARALHVIITVSGGSAVQSTGSWTTITPADLTTTTVTRTNTGLTYDITLKPGQTLPAATYRFGIQFNRPAAGHDFAADTYSVSVVTTDLTDNNATATGTFDRA